MPMRKCMYMTSAARIADTIAAGARKEIGAASSFQEMNMSAFPRHTGAISGMVKGCSSPEREDMITAMITVKGTVTAYEGMCCRE